MVNNQDVLGVVENNPSFVKGVDHAPTSAHCLLWGGERIDGVWWCDVKWDEKGNGILPDFGERKVGKLWWFSQMYTLYNLHIHILSYIYISPINLSIQTLVREHVESKIWCFERQLLEAHKLTGARLEPAVKPVKLLPETWTKFAPENCWLEYYFCFEKAWFQGRTVSFRECSYSFFYQSWKWKTIENPFPLETKLIQGPKFFTSEIMGRKRIHLVDSSNPVI